MIDQELEDAVFKYCALQKSVNIPMEQWFKMTIAKNIRRAFREGAEWQKKRTMDREERGVEGTSSQ